HLAGYYESPIWDCDCPFIVCRVLSPFSCSKKVYPRQVETFKYGHRGHFAKPWTWTESISLSFRSCARAGKQAVRVVARAERRQRGGKEAKSYRLCRGITVGFLGRLGLPREAIPHGWAQGLLLDAEA